MLLPRIPPKLAPRKSPCEGHPDRCRSARLKKLRHSVRFGTAPSRLQRSWPPKPWSSATARPYPKPKSCNTDWHSKGRSGELRSACLIAISNWKALEATREILNLRVRTYKWSCRFRFWLERTPPRAALSVIFRSAWRGSFPLFVANPRTVRLFRSGTLRPVYWPIQVWGLRRAAAELLVGKRGELEGRIPCQYRRCGYVVCPAEQPIWQQRIPCRTRRMPTVRLSRLIVQTLPAPSESESNDVMSEHVPQQVHFWTALC